MKLADTIALHSTSPPMENLRPILQNFQNSAPVDVIGLAQALGLNVWELPLPPNISGKIWKDQVNGGRSGYSIGVNATEAFVRKRFTVAHECATSYFTEIVSRMNL